MVEVYKLAYELEVSSIQIIEAMKELDIPVQLPNPSMSTDDAQKIRASFKKSSGFLFKNGSLFITAVLSITLLLSINSNKVFADDTAPPAITSSNSTISEPTVFSLPAFKEQAVVASNTIRDSFTVMVQEKLIDLGLLSGPATGDNDKSTQQAIKSFQEKAGLEKIDGMVGPETLPKLLLGEAAYTTTAPLTSNSNGPVWGDDQLKFMRINGTYLDVLWGDVTDDKAIDKFHLYVDGILFSTIDAAGCENHKCSSNTSNRRFKINGLTPETTYEFEVVACDVDGNCSTNNPTTTQSTVDKPPVWDESLPLTVSELGTRFNLNIPVGAVTDDVEVSYYEVYVNHELSTFRTISDTRLFVLHKYDMTCGPQEVYIIAYDTIGQSSKSPTTKFTRNECGTAVAASPTTTTTLPGTPSMTITASEVSDGDTSSDSALSLTFTASASTTDFAVGDISVSGGTLSNFSGSGTTYTATFTPTAQGATTIDVASSTFTNASTSTDNTAATQFNWTYSTAPTIAITASEVSDGATSSDSALSLTFTTSQSTTNFAAGDVVVSGGTLSNFSGSGTTYTATFTPSAAGATTIDVAANTFTNAFSTNNTAATQFNWTYVVTSKLAACGDSSTNANRWVVSVIDEDSGGPSAGDLAAQWSNFRSSYPNRCFHLLEPKSSNDNYNFSQPNGLTSSLKIPTAFMNEFSAGTTFHARVSRTDAYSVVSGTSDWWDLIGASVLPSGAKIVLSIDNSGSMYASTVQDSLDLFEQKAAAAGVTITPGSGANNSNYSSVWTRENWIAGLQFDIN